MKTDTQPWQLATGSWLVKLRDPDRAAKLWNVSLVGGEGANGWEKTVSGDTRFTVKAARRTDCSLVLTPAPADQAATLSLRSTFEGGTFSKAVAFGQIDGLTAGEYELEIDDTANKAYRLDTDALDQALISGKPRTLRFTVTHDKLSLTVPFCDRRPPCKFPFQVVVASYAKVGGQQIETPKGAKGVALDESFTEGTSVAFYAIDGKVEYFRGKVIGQGDKREIQATEGALTGTFQATGPLNQFEQVVLKPEELFAPGAAGEPSLPPGKWTGLPVGRYRLSAQVQLPGLGAPFVLDDNTPVTVGPGGATSDLSGLLARLPALLPPVLGKLDHPVTFAVQQESVVNGKAGPRRDGPAADLALERDSLATDGAAQKLRDLRAPAAAIELLEGYRPPAVVSEGGKLLCRGLREGTYKVTVTPREGAGAYTPASLRSTCKVDPGDADRVCAIILQSCSAQLPFKPTAPEKWSLYIGDDRRELRSDGLLPVSGGAESSKVVMKWDGTPAWEGRVENGVLSPAPGFLKGTFTLEGVLPGMTAQLVEVPDTVALLQTDQKEQYHLAGGRPAETRVTWDGVPVGQYWLEVAGFERAGPLTIRDATSYKATDLKPRLADLKLTLAADMPEADIRSISLVGVDVPYRKLQSKNDPLNPKDTNWRLSLPFGSYRLVGSAYVSEKGERVVRDGEQLISLPDQTEFAVTPAFFNKLRLVPVELTGVLSYHSAPTSPDADPGGKTESSPLDAGADQVSLTPGGGGEPIVLKAETRTAPNGRKVVLFAGHVAPGAYTVTLTTRTVDDGGKRGGPVVCSTPNGALAVTVPAKDEAVFRVSVSCEVSSARPSKDLTITGPNGNAAKPSSR